MPAWLIPALLAGAQVLGKAGQGQGQERQNKNSFELDKSRLDLQAQQANNANLLQALGLNESAQMNRAKLGIEAPSARTKQALLGSLLQNARTARITPPSGIRMGAMSGGLDLDSLINAAARKAGGTLQGQATRALETGSDIPAYTDATSRLGTVGANPAYQKAGKLESILSLLGLAGSVGGAAYGARRG